MIKKCIFIFTTILCIFCINYEVFAYETEKFSIEIPSSYITDGNNSFTDNNGNTISIMSQEVSSTYGFEYNKKNLDTIAKSVNESPEKIKESIEKILMEKYSDNLSYDEIKNIANNLKYDITLKEITTFTKNKYKCFHLKYICSFFNKTEYGDQYIFLSGKDLYYMTVATYSQNINKDLQEIIDSFTLKNFENSVTDEHSSGVLEKIITTTIATLILGAIFGIHNEKKLNENNVENHDITYITCNTCGKQIDSNSKFCCYCGKNLEKNDNKE